MQTAPLLEEGQPAQRRSGAVQGVAIFAGLCLVGLVVAANVPSQQLQAASGEAPEATNLIVSHQKTHEEPYKGKKLRTPAAVFGEVGVLMLVLPCLWSGFSMGHKGFEKISEKARLPCPVVMGYLGALTTIIGSLLVVVCPLLPQDVAGISVGGYTLGGLLDLIGADLLLVFMAAATFLGHVKPLKDGASGDEATKHQLAVVKNAGIMGGLFCILSTGSSLGKLSFRQDIFGRFLCCLPCILACFGVGFAGFTGIAKHQGFPAPKFFGAMAILFAGWGSALVILARYLPGYKLVTRGPMYSLVATTIGAFMVTIFLIIATYLGHWKPMKQKVDADGHWQNILKNISLIGCQFVILATGWMHP